MNNLTCGPRIDGPERTSCEPRQAAVLPASIGPNAVVERKADRNGMSVKSATKTCAGRRLRRKPSMRYAVQSFTAFSTKPRKVVISSGFPWVSTESCSAIDTIADDIAPEISMNGAVSPT